MTKSSSGSHRHGATVRGAGPADAAETADAPQPTAGGRAAARRAAAGSGQPAAGGRAAARRGRKKKAQGGKKALKVVGLTMGVVLVLGVGTAAYAYWKLTGNIKSDDLSANGKGAGKEPVDAFGRSPINILVIGSDGRNDAADCKLGGHCVKGGGARADVEMVVHISADRSNATVMSIPRDLRSDWSACNDPNHPSMAAQTNAMINSALSGGPGCSVDAVHELTGIPIDHFMMVEFHGVVDISNAVGGVPVCVDKNIYDPYSHLKLKKGDHVLKGESALQFVRTRHGFGDSSDSRGRTVAQHLFLSNMLNTLKNKGTLSSPTKMWGIAQAATKALTVDKSLDSPTKLIGLATDLNKVPTSRITFATMQTYDTTKPPYETHLAEGATEMFKTIANDQSLTAAQAAGKPASPTAAPVVKSSVAVQVQNGTTIQGRAGAIKQELVDQGFSKDTASGNGDAAATTSLTYPADQKAQAQAVAKALGLPAKALKQGTGSGLVLLIGNDWSTGTTFPGGAPAPVNTQAALADANDQTANEQKCATVSPFKDVIGLDENGKPTSSDHVHNSTSPTRAYDLVPNIKDSAP